MKTWITITLACVAALAHGQTSKTPIYNGILQSNLDANGFSIVNAAGGSSGTVTSITATTPIIVTPSPLIATGVISLNSTSKTNWDTAYTQTRQWDGGATGLVAATGRTSLALVPGTNVEVPLTFSTGLTRTTNTVTVNTSQNIATLSNLTTNGFVKTGGAVGTLSVDTATYQAADADLTTWAGVTPTSGIQTWLATPSSANLRGALTDENGTGAALFSGATTPDFTTGFTIGGAAASGKIPIGNGTNYVPSTPTFSNAPSTALKWMRSDGTNWITSTSLLSDTPGTALKWLRSDGTNWITSTSLMSDTPGTAGKMLISDGTNWITSTAVYPNTAGTAGYTLRSDGTNIVSYPQDLLNSSVSSQSPSTSDVYLTGSNVTFAAGDVKAKGQYRCLFDVTKSAGTGAIVISVRVGTGGVVGDPQILSFTFTAGTSVADVGTFEVIATWRTVGSGTSAVMQGICRANKNTATAAGLWGVANDSQTIVATTSSGFNSSTATNIGVSFNGSTAFAGTVTLVQASLLQ